MDVWEKLIFLFSHVFDMVSFDLQVIAGGPSPHSNTEMKKNMKVEPAFQFYNDSVIK